MVKPPARPLIRCAPVCLAAAAFVIGGVALPGVALPGAALAARGAALSAPAARGAALSAPAARGAVLAAPARLPDVPGIPAGVPDIARLSPVTGLPSIAGLPSVEGLLPGIALPTPAWQHLDPLRPVRRASAKPAPVPGLGGAAQPGDPDGWFDHEEPDEPAPDEEPPDVPEPDVPEPDGEEPDAEAPAVPDAPARPVEPLRPTIGPPPATGAAPRPAPVSPSPRQPRTPTTTPSPADTRGLDELFPDRSSTDTPAGAPRGSTAGGEPVGYARPLIYSGIAGMLISAIGIGVVLNRRRGW